MKKVFLSIGIIFVLVGQGISYGQMPYHDFPPTPAFRYVGTPSGQISAKNYYYPLNVTGSGCVSVTGVNSTHTMTISGSACGSSANQGTYNTTQANNVNINVGGSKINFINGTNGQVNVINSPGKNQVNITIGSTTPTGITSINSQTGPAITIKGAHGTSVTSSANTITVNSTIYQNNTGANLGTSGTGVFSSMSGSVLQFLKLISGNSNLVLSSNSTNIIFTLNNVLNSAIIRINGNMSANQTIATTTPITITDSGSTHTIGCGTCITSDSDNYLTSINSQTGPAINIVCASNNTTCTNSTNQIKINTGNNLAYVAKPQTFTQTNTFTKVIQTSQNGSVANTGFGTGALNLNDGANYNSAFGNDALFQISNGNTSSAFGALALFSSTSGFKNTALGAGALEDIMSGSNNIAIGYNAGTSYTGSETNNIIIGASGTTGESNILRIGSILIGNLNTNTIISKMKLTNTASTVGLNLGTVTSYATSPRQGDIEIVGNSIKFQDNTNTTQTITPSSYLTSGTAVTQVNTFTGKVNITGQTGNVTITNSSGIIKIGHGINDFIINGAYQDVSKGAQFDKLNDTSKIVSGKDTTKAITFLNSGMTTGVTTTIRNNATTSQGINIPATRQTETFAIRPQINFTASSNKTGASTTAGMLGDGVTLTPSVTGRIEVTVSAYITSSIAADGGVVQIRQITGNCVGNGVALTGTALGSDIKITDAATTGRTPFSITVLTTGLSLGQKYCFELSQQATTGGTFTIFNVMWAAKEI